MSTIVRNILLVAMIATTSACGALIGPAPDRQLFILPIATCTTPPAITAQSVLLLRATTASKLIDSQRIIFSETPQTRGYYQFASWADSPTRQLNTALLDQLQCAALFRWVSRGHESVLADYALSTEILEFRHDFSEKPGKAVVAMRIELYDLKNDKLLSSTSFASEAPVKAFNAEAAVAALGSATQDILDRTVEWTKMSMGMP